MSDSSTTVRVQSYTKELINKHSKRLGVSQGELIEQAILVAEKMDFEYDVPLDKIKKMQVSETNRLIGFLKTQDKNLKQTEENIYHYFKKNLHEDRRAILEYFYFRGKQYMEESAKEYYSKADVPDPKTLTLLFLTRFNTFFSEAYEKLLSEHHKELQ